MINKLDVLNTYLLSFKIRKIEEVIASEYSKGLMRCPTHLSIGQELVPSVLSLFLSNNDQVVSTHRSHAHYIAKGGDLSGLFDELFGLPSGCSGGNGGSMHLKDRQVGFMGSTAIVGNTIPIGVGLAEALKLSSKEHIVVIYLGDGAVEEGVFWECLNYSSVRGLPCLFMIENNEFSVYTPIHDRQPKGSILKRASGFVDHCSLIKNHDFNHLFSELEKAIPFVREGKPAVFEVETFRYREHCGPNFDDDLGYRANDYLDKWNKMDILCLLEKELRQNYLFTGEKLETMTKDIASSIGLTYQDSLSRRITFSNGQ